MKTTMLIAILMSLICSVGLLVVLIKMCIGINEDYSWVAIIPTAASFLVFFNMFQPLVSKWFKGK